jgi:hypothetical protein
VSCIIGPRKPRDTTLLRRLPPAYPPTINVSLPPCDSCDMSKALAEIGQGFCVRGIGEFCDAIEYHSAACVARCGRAWPGRRPSRCDAGGPSPFARWARRRPRRSTGGRLLARRGWPRGADGQHRAAGRGGVNNKAESSPGQQRSGLCHSSSFSIRCIWLLGVTRKSSQNSIRSPSSTRMQGSFQER